MSDTFLYDQTRLNTSADTLTIPSGSVGRGMIGAGDFVSLMVLTYPDPDALRRRRAARLEILEDARVDALIERVLGDEVRWKASRADSDVFVAKFLKDHPDGGAVELPDPTA